MADAARLLPLLGVFLVFLPILWRPAQSSEADTAGGGVYLFTVWLVLIAAALFLSRLLSAPPSQDASGDEEPR